MNRRDFIGAALSGMATTALSAEQQPDAGSGPNVLVFFTDQQRWDSIGAYGNPMGLTPNLDRMAAAGTRFANAFTPKSDWSNVGADSGVRIILNYSGFPPGARLLVPDAIAGIDAAIGIRTRAQGRIGRDAMVGDRCVCSWLEVAAAAAELRR